MILGSPILGKLHISCKIIAYYWVSINGILVSILWQSNMASRDIPKANGGL
jgi:hypothetical protein